MRRLMAQHTLMPWTGEQPKAIKALQKGLDDFANYCKLLCGRGWHLSSPDWIAAAYFFQQGSRVRLTIAAAAANAMRYQSHID